MFHSIHQTDKVLRVIVDARRYESSDQCFRARHMFRKLLFKLSVNAALASAFSRKNNFKLVITFKNIIYITDGGTITQNRFFQ